MTTRTRLKDVAQLRNDQLVVAGHADTPIDYIDIGSVATGRLVREPARYLLGEAPSRARQRVQADDIILSTVRTYLRAILQISSATEHCVVSTGFAVLRARAGIHPRWLLHALEGSDFLDEVSRHSTGMSYPAISASRLMALQIEVPAFEDQQTIARYLDNAELRIARAIQAKQRTLSLVLERERALLADLLTPYIPQRLGGAADADLAVAPLRAVYQESNERSVTGGEELLSVSHITGVTPRSHKNVTMFMAASHIGYKLVQPDDLAVNTMWAWMGAMGVSEYPGIVSPSYSVYRPRPNSPLLPAYLHHLLRSAAYVDEYNRASTGVTASRARLYPWQLLRLPVCLPDEGAQRRVLADANSVAASTAAAADALRTEIALLREYRTRLISDVVSGKKDVRAEAAGMKDVGPAELATVLGGATDSGNDDVEGDEDVE